MLLTRLIQERIFFSRQKKFDHKLHNCKYAITYGYSIYFRAQKLAIKTDHKTITIIEVFEK